MKDHRPLFSITTPCWNSVSTIERTIKSILSQDFKDYEYIIVDGGSNDGTLDIIKKYEPLFDGRMRWKSEPDEGLYDAFNKGVRNSEGIYCWNVNADDFMEPGALSKLADFISSSKWSELPVIAGVLRFVSFDGSKTISVMKSNENHLYKCFKRDHIGIPHPATLVPKGVYEKYGVYDTHYKLIGDNDWFHRVYAAEVKFIFFDGIITNMADGGISNQFHYKKSLRDRLYYLRKFYPNRIDRIIRFIYWNISFYISKSIHYIKK